MGVVFYLWFVVWPRFQRFLDTPICPLPKVSELAPMPPVKPPKVPT